MPQQSEVKHTENNQNYGPKSEAGPTGFLSVSDVVGAVAKQEREQQVELPLEQSDHHRGGQRVPKTHDVSSPDSFPRTVREVGKVHQHNPKQSKTPQDVGKQVSLIQGGTSHSRTFRWRMEMARASEGQIRTWP